MSHAMENAHVGLFGWRGLNAISENISVAIGLTAIRTPARVGLGILGTHTHTHTVRLPH